LGGRRRRSRSRNRSRSVLVAGSSGRSRSRHNHSTSRSTRRRHLGHLGTRCRHAGKWHWLIEATVAAVATGRGERHGLVVAAVSAIATTTTAETTPATGRLVTATVAAATACRLVTATVAAATACRLVTTTVPTTTATLLLVTTSVTATTTGRLTLVTGAPTAASVRARFGLAGLADFTALERRLLLVVVLEAKRPLATVHLDTEATLHGLGIGR
jgi:hypothetical protein